MKTTKQLIQEAIFIYEGGACNPIAIINALHALMTRLKDENQDSNGISRHPGIRLILAQLSFLAGDGIGECEGALDAAQGLLCDLQAFPAHTATTTTPNTEPGQPLSGQLRK